MVGIYAIFIHRENKSEISSEEWILNIVEECTSTYKLPGQILAKMKVLLGFHLTRGGKYKD
jgi:hypothetical protein